MSEEGTCRRGEEKVAFPRERLLELFTRENLLSSFKISHLPESTRNSFIIYDKWIKSNLEFSEEEENKKKFLRINFPFFFFFFFWRRGMIRCRAVQLQIPNVGLPVKNRLIFGSDHDTERLQFNSRVY